MNAADMAHRFEADRLMVIIPDRLSDLIAKGEVTERYYNPGNLFREVHIVLTNDNKPEPAAVRPMVGSAKLVLHNLDPGPKFFHHTLGWQSVLMRDYVAQMVALARAVRPALVRTHNNFLEGYLAVRIKRELGTPFVTSLHGVWDRDSLHTSWLKERTVRFFRRRLETATLQNADAVIAVYAPILRYARRLGARNVHLVYNAVSSRIQPKAGYALGSPPRFITVNRQLPQKNPENIIRAVAGIDCRYTLIGTGPYHEFLKKVAADSGCSEKVEFIEAMPNEALCRSLPGYDLMLSHCDYWGISKTTIEAALAGLPVILNRHPAGGVPDLEGDWLVLCDNTPEGYAAAIRSLLADEKRRSAVGQSALAHAGENFDPVSMERKLAAIYVGAMSPAS